MGKNVFWKSVVRRKGILLLFLALLTAASFGFMLRALEYLAVNQELSRIAEQYRPIGMPEVDGDGENEISELKKAVEFLENSPWVESVDTGKYTSAVLKDMYNADTDGWTTQFASSEENSIRINEIMAWAKLVDVKKTTTPGNFRYGFKVEQAVYGYPDYLKPQNKIVCYLSSRQAGGTSDPVMEEGKTYLIRCSYPPVGNSSNGNVLLFDLLPLDENVWFVEAEGDARENPYLDQTDLEVFERNLHGMCAITTVDMGALPAVQDATKTLHLEDGRWLNSTDQKEKRPVCVIEKGFAAARELQTGDTLRVMLENWASDRGTGYVAESDQDAWRSCEKTELELEIVGIYSMYYGENAGNFSRSSDGHFFYIPESIVPSHYRKDAPLHADSVSFVLQSPKCQDAFMQDAKAYGVNFTFVENNWESYFQSAKQIARGARFNLIIFSAVLVLALIFVCFLYTWQRRKEIAIARALGVPAKTVAASSCLPLIVFGFFAMAAGSGAGWYYGVKTVQKTLAAIRSADGAELSAGWFFAIGLSMILALAFLALAGSFFYAGLPVLAILHQSAGHSQRRKRKGQKTADSAAVPAVSFDAKLLPSVSAAERPSPFSAMGGFLLHHLRIRLRTVLAFLTAAVFAAALSWLGQSIQNSEKKLADFCLDTVVHASITKKESRVYTVYAEDAGAYIYPSTVAAIMDTGFVKSVYTEAGSTNRIGMVDKNTGMKKMSFLGIGDMEQFLGREWEVPPEIHYGDGYDGGLFSETCTLTEDGQLSAEMGVILPKKLWDKWGVKAGDRLKISDRIEHVTVTAVAAGFYEDPLFGFPGDMVLVPAALQSALELTVNYVTVNFEIDPAKNRELDELRTFAEQVVSRREAGRVALSFVLWDSELRQVAEPLEKNIRLMRLFYPIACGAVCFIAAGLSVLLLFQRRREASILRVLGVGAAPVRLVLALELVLISLFGVCAGLLAAFLFAGAGSAADLGLAAGMYLLGSLLGTAVGCLAVTGAKPLELLHEKE